MPGPQGPSTAQGKDGRVEGGLTCWDDIAGSMAYAEEGTSSRDEKGALMTAVWASGLLVGEILVLCFEVNLWSVDFS